MRSHSTVRVQLWHISSLLSNLEFYILAYRRHAGSLEYCFVFEKYCPIALIDNMQINVRRAPLSYMLFMLKYLNACELQSL